MVVYLWGDVISEVDQIIAVYAIDVVIVCTHTKPA